jgi:hypothetical protein
MRVFPPGTEGAGCILLADFGLDSAWLIGERLVTLVLILLTAVMTSCFSSILETASSSSSDCKSPKGSRRTGGKGFDSMGAISNIGESRLVSDSFNLLMTILLSRHRGIAFAEGGTDGA